MPDETPGPSVPKLFDDIVLTGCMALGILIALYLSYALVVQGADYPPTLISTFLGLSLAAIVYRFMGGLTGTEFGVGALKVGGSAAFIVAFIWLVGDRLRDEVELYASTDSYREQIAGLEKQRDDAQALSDQRQKQVDVLQGKLLAAPQAQGVYTINQIKAMKADNPFVQSLKRLVEGGQPPFSDVVRELVVPVSVIGGSSNEPTFSICPAKLAELNEGIEAPRTELQLSRTLDDGTPVSFRAARSGFVSKDQCDKPKRDFEMQINCAAALKLFADRIASCAEGATVRGQEITIGALAD